MNAPARRSIFIAIPAYDGKLEYATVMSLHRAYAECLENGWEIQIFIRSGDALITRARNVLAATFLASAATDLLFVDSDLGWNKGSFARLMKHDVDFVFGCYRFRRDPEDYPVRSLPDGSMTIDGKTGLMEVAGGPTGFMRLRRTVIEQLTAAKGDNWYEEDSAPGLKLYPLFETELRDHKLWSEDFTFCRSWRDGLGGKIYADPSLVMHHTGPRMHSGSFAAFLANDPKFKVPPTVEVPPAGPTTSILDLARAAAE